MAIFGIKGYGILLRGDVNNLAENRYETEDQGVTSTLKYINKTACNKIILYQEDTVYFHIFKEEKKKPNKYGDTRQAGEKS